MKTSALKRWSVICYTFVLIFSLSVWNEPQQAEAATSATVQSSSAGITADDPAPFIEPTVVNEHAGQKVLFDNTHGQTAGAADWVINGGFSDFAHGLADDGYYVKELRKTTPIIYDDLKDYNVLVIGEANIPYKASEQAALLKYVQNGGSIFFIADHYNADRNKNRWDASEVFNGYRRGAFDNPAKGMGEKESASAAMQDVESSDWLADNFGVRFRYNAIGDVTANQVVSPDESLGITEGVDTVAMHAGSTLAILDPHHAKGIVYLPQTDQVWSHAVDQGVYDGGGKAEGPFAAISKVGGGKAAFIGDSSPVEDATPKYLREDTGEPKTTYDGFKEQNDAGLLVNMVEWLSEKESYTSFDGKVTLDKPTSLHDFEQPENSTEPEPEPWAAPEPGYKWWDPSTFKPGSYGSDEEAANPVYSFVHQAELPGNEQVFKIRVAADNLAPLAAVDDLKVGLYLPGGEQIGKFSLDGKNWPSNYGYSSPFAMVSGATGHAARELYVKIKADKLGRANLRLKQGSKTLYTESVTVSNVPVEPLPGDGDGVIDLVDIKDARSGHIGDLFKVKGVISTEPGIFGAQGFYLQDDTGGIYVFQRQTGFHAGDKVAVTGKLDEFNGELELSSPVIQKQGTTGVPNGEVVNEINEANQGQIVTLKGVTIQDIQKADNYGSVELTAVKGGYSVLVRIDNRIGLDYDHFPYQNGNILNITGASSQFKGTYQLKPRGENDLEFADGKAPVTTATVTCDNLSGGSCLDHASVTLNAKDDMSGIEKLEFKLNGSEWTTYQSPVTLNASGTLLFGSTDKAGNVEETKTLNVTVTTVDFNVLEQWIDNASLKPKGLKRAFKAHLHLAERHQARAEAYGLNSKKGRKEWSLRNKILHHDLQKVMRLSNRHIDNESRHDLQLIFKHLINQ
ncbi:hypothetical protein EV207_10883 [Scopulibacillus darangshiensis]|uniref:DUF5689 domain-containing protein n=1 Tax=Scopulibacillus darangshiensis TaxID=442528 RepID=A0A4R2P726_9BACL|nr:DUF5689 domain-containing protein [Scopulibacillus darangshiensis]TCP29791.1 hypothetical protein EV207_10883 [Scopulibacillus darangshiensis]